jgi:hypothetical protein
MAKPAQYLTVKDHATRLPQQKLMEKVNFEKPEDKMSNP